MSNFVDTILEGLPPTKFERAQNVQNLARFFTTFDCDRKYLWNGSTQRKSEIHLINCTPPHWMKNFWWTLVH